MLKILNKEVEYFYNIENFEEAHLKPINLPNFKDELFFKALDLRKIFYDDLHFLKFLCPFDNQFLYYITHGFNSDCFVLLDKNMGDMCLLTYDLVKEIKMNLSEIKECLSFFYGNSIQIDFYSEDLELTKENILNRAKELIEKRKRVREIEEKERIEEERAEAEKEKIYREKGEAELDRVIITKKIILDKKNSDKIELKNDVNSLLKYPNLPVYYDVEAFERMLIEKEIDYSFSNNECSYILDFHPLKLNGELIKKERLIRAIERLKLKEDIQGLTKNKMPQIFYAVINLKEIDYSDSSGSFDFPIKIICTNEKERLFNIEFLDKVKEVNWDFIKEVFIDGKRTRSHLYFRHIVRLYLEFGYDKESCFEDLRKRRVLNQLKNN